MTLSVYIPAIGGHEMLSGTKKLLRDNASGRVDIITIDNASKVPFTGIDVIRNEENLGMMGSLRQAVEHSDTDILVYMHSDMRIFEPSWDEKLMFHFSVDPKLAAVGVVGATQADLNGGRSDTVCAFRSAHLHGRLPDSAITPVALLDGCFMAFRRAYLEMLDWDNFEDNGYFFSYDKDLTLTFTMQSLHVAVVNFDCEHLSGQTSCGPEFQEALQKKQQSHNVLYQASEMRYLEKWGPSLPIRVTPEWVVHTNGR